MRIRSEDKDSYQTLQFIRFELLWESSLCITGSAAAAFTAGRQASVGVLGLGMGALVEMLS